MDWIRELDMADLPEAHRGLAELIGMEAMAELVRTYGGEYVYIPNETKLESMVRNRRMVRDYQSGVNANALARKYGLSYNQIYVIIRKEMGQGISGQISLFDTE